MTRPSFDPGFTTPALAAIYSSEARVAAMCRVEAALAVAASEAGILERAVADQIVAVCGTPIPDPDELLADGWRAGTPVLPLLEVLRSRLPDDIADRVHHGATTQDVVDTAAVLQARDAVTVLHDDLGQLARTLRDHVATHRDTPATGWTFLQPAVPTTMGLRMAGWLAPVLGHRRALVSVRDRLPVQLGGPSGTLDALGADALAVVDALAAHLDLAVPDLPWHTDRTVFADLMGLLERVARTMATVGTDLALLAHDGAVRMRAGGSSSMPGKRNPIDAVRAVAAAEACAGATSVVTRGRPHELERAIGGWHAEWWAVPLAFQACAAAVEAIGDAIASLEVVDAPADGDGGPTPASGAFVDRVVAACDEAVGA